MLFRSVESAVDKGRPFLGICVGMQLMASMGREYEYTAGLGWISGEVTKITPRDPSLKVPHMGWNDLVIDHPHPVFDGIETGDHTYFVHSYHMDVQDDAERLAHVDYAGDVTAVIGRDTMIGMQFHPEKKPDNRPSYDCELSELAPLNRAPPSTEGGSRSFRRKHFLCRSVTASHCRRPTSSPYVFLTQKAPATCRHSSRQVAASYPRRPVCQPL